MRRPAIMMAFKIKMHSGFTPKHHQGTTILVLALSLLAFGELYLNGGRVNSRQVVSQTWVRQSWLPRARSSWSGREYGYGWMNTLAGHQARFAWGHGGQFIFVVPSVKMVVAITSVPLPGEGRREHQSALYDLMEQDLVPAAERHRLARLDLSSRRELL